MPREKYNLPWQDDVDDAEIERYMIRQGGQWIQNGMTFGHGLFFHYRALQTILWPEDDHHRWSDLILKNILANRITAVYGSRDCLAGGARIPNPITGESPTIQELYESGNPTWVNTLYGPALASAPFIKGYGALYEVTLSNGERFTCSPKHFVLTFLGYAAVKSLSPGQAICSAWPKFERSISEPCLSTRAEDGRHCSRIVPDSPVGYPNDSCSCDAPLRMARAVGQVVPPSPAGVPTHTQDNCNRDESASKQERNHFGSQFYPLSTEDCSRHENAKARNQCSRASKTHEHDSRWCRWPFQSVSNCAPVLGRVSGLVPGGFRTHLGYKTQLQPYAQLCPVFSSGHESFLGEDSFGQQPNRDDQVRGIVRSSFVYLPHGEISDSSLQYKVVEIVVQSIKYVGEGLFYDLTVPDYHHYIAEGAIHHNSSKTRTVSKWALCDYYAFPHETLTLMTSTDTRGLELRVWGDIKSLHERARERFSWLDGNVADSKHGIFTDSISAGEEVRDMRKGIIGIPCLSSQGEYMGMALKNFAGIKQKRRRLVGDELQFLPREYLKVLDSLDKGDFKAALLGNPIAENGKALDAVSEPVGGWDSIGEVTKTTDWKNKYNGVTINLVGIDSPNFDKETLNRFPYMVDQGDVDRVSKRPGGRDSLEWWSQIMGVRKVGAITNRVLTIAEIEAYDGFKDCLWSGTNRTRVYSIDAGFGGDPCVRTWLEFGESADGKQLIRFGDQKEIPILLSSDLTPEKQIARYARDDCHRLSIPASNLFCDAGMYATLMVELAREMSSEVNAVNFGGTATDRPVSDDTLILDEATGTRRPKTWYEHVSKFVTELWFVVRLLAQCRQARMFPREAAQEFERRQWRYVYNDRYELETKDDYKLRNSGESPNHADSLVIAVEGARRLGFVIKGEHSDNTDQSEAKKWLAELQNKHYELVRSKQLSYAT